MWQRAHFLIRGQVRPALVPVQRKQLEKQRVLAFKLWLKLLNLTSFPQRENRRFSTLRGRSWWLLYFSESSEGEIARPFLAAMRFNATAASSLEALARQFFFRRG